MDLKNRTAVVTGAAQGIGLSIAQKLASLGANVSISDINLEKAKESAEEINKQGGRAVGLYCDVSDVKSIEELMDKTAAHFGSIDILVNNAGILHVSAIEDITVEEWDKVLDINLRGTFFAIQKALPYLKKSTAPRVINISSVAGRMGSYASGMGYVASKGGVISLTYGLARQFAPLGITVNAVCPGTVMSDIVKQWSREQLSSLESKIPLGRLGQPSDIASGVAFLASDEASFITGHCLDVNGGMYFG